MAELVYQQVGFEVVVLDSKCFPIIECESTTSMEFWKSNRRVLVASKALYQKLGGSSTSLSSTNDEIDLTHSDEEVTNLPQPKRCCLSKNKKILVCMEAIKSKVDLSDVISGVFECVICKDILQPPQFSLCCQRIIGCHQCICHWFGEHNTCPHCATPGAVSDYMDVRGMDDMLVAMHLLHSDTMSSSPISHTLAKSEEMMVTGTGTVTVTLNFRQSPFATAVPDFCHTCVCTVYTSSAFSY